MCFDERISSERIVAFMWNSLFAGGIVDAATFTIFGHVIVKMLATTILPLG